MKPVFHSKINNINELRLTRVFLLVSLFLLISIQGLAQTAVASNSGPICAGEDVTLSETGGVAVSWVWSSDGSATFSSETAQNPIAYDAVDGEIFTVEIDGTTTSATTTVTVYALPTVVITDPSAVCSPATVDLTAASVTAGSTAGLTFSYWEDAGATTEYLTPAAATDGTYYIKGTTSEGCYDIKAVTVTVFALPVTTASDNGPVCAGNQLSLTGGTDGMTTYAWTGPNGFSSVLQSPAVSAGATAAMAGLYTLTVTNSYGCQNTATTTVTVNALPNPTLTSSDTDNIFCAGTSVTFTAGDGTSYNFRVGGVSVRSGASATYTTSSLSNGQVVDVIVTNANGCTATSTGITNFVNPLPFIIVTSPPACEADLVTYSLEVTVSSGTVTSTSGTVTNTGGNVWTITGVLSGTNITITVTDGNSCESTLVVTAPDCSCPTVTAPISGGDKSYCESGIIPTITATVSTGETVDWYNSSSGGTLLKGGSLSYTPSTAGTYYAMARDIATGCVSSTRTPVTVTMNGLPNPTLTSSDADNIFCAGTSVTFTAGGGTSYNFRVGGVSVRSGASATYTTSSLTNGQVVDVIVTNTNGCTATSTGIANTVNALPTANAGTGGSECDLNFKFNALASIGTGTWTLTLGPGTATFAPDANTATATVTVSEYGTYTFTWTEVNGTCSNSSTITVNFYQRPVANAGTGGEECDLDFALNAIPGNGTGTWTLTSGPGNAIFSPAIHHPDATVTVDQYGTYDFAWTEVNVTCQSIDMVRVVFHALPPVSAGRDTIICKDESVQLQANGEGIFLWEPAAMVNDANISDPDATPGSTTIFKVTLTDQYGCINSDEVEVAVWEQPVANAGPDQVLENLFGTTMEAELGINETGTWSVFSGTGEFFDSTYPATTVSNLSLNENGLIWTVTNEVCPVSSDTVFITVNNLVIPTLITPNMDGRNDYFVLRGIETLGKTELIIFDRRGAQVYKNSNYDNGWNGVDYNGNPLTDDTYFFIMKTGKGKSISGYIVIRR